MPRKDWHKTQQKRCGLISRRLWSAMCSVGRVRDDELLDSEDVQTLKKINEELARLWAKYRANAGKHA